MVWRVPPPMPKEDDQDRVEDAVDGAGEGVSCDDAGVRVRD